MNPIIIIGSGLAGYVLAKEFRKLDEKAPLVLITQSDGRFYSKPLLSTAFAHKRSIEDLAVADADTMRQQLNAEILTRTAVTAVDPEKKTIVTEKRRFQYNKLIFAVGANAYKLPFNEAAFSVNNLEDYEVFKQALLDKKRVGIVGCGLVGCEFADDLMSGGYEVEVVSLSCSPLDRFLPPKIGKVLQQALADKGVTWHLKKLVNQIEVDNTGFHLRLEGDKPLHFDAILSAIGLKPNIVLAKLANLNINKGIIVNRYLETNHEHIYALGDCAEVEGHVLQFVTPLMQCARALAKTLAGNRTAVSYPVMPIVLKTPTCPTVFYPPFGNPKGEWKEMTGEGKNWRALFYDQQNQLQGFVLTGEHIRDKIKLIKEIPALIL